MRENEQEKGAFGLQEPSLCPQEIPVGKWADSLVALGFFYAVSIVLITVGNESVFQMDPDILAAALIKSVKVLRIYCDTSFLLLKKLAELGISRCKGKI